MAKLKIEEVENIRDSAEHLVFVRETYSLGGETEKARKATSAPANATTVGHVQHAVGGIHFPVVKSQIMAHARQKAGVGQLAALDTIDAQRAYHSVEDILGAVKVGNSTIEDIKGYLADMEFNPAASLSEIVAMARKRGAPASVLKLLSGLPDDKPYLTASAVIDQLPVTEAVQPYGRATIDAALKEAAQQVTVQGEDEERAALGEAYRRMHPGRSEQIEAMVKGKGKEITKWVAEDI